MVKIRITSLIITFLLSSGETDSQDTFSITAVDQVTGFVGSAGASCIAGSIILSDIHPGRGVIHTQVSYNSQNQNYARYLMNQGYSPQQIIDSLIARDAGNNPTIRQYGITDYSGNNIRRAAYTGVNCMNYKNHVLGINFTVQGNILLGQQILDSMVSRFLNTQGTFTDKLMASLQGAKLIGADTRCTGRGTSSISAFIRVARPTDPSGGPYWLDLNVNNTPVGRDPIDSLQVLYNNWVATGISNNQNIYPEKFRLYQNYPNPFNPVTTIRFDIEKLSDVKLTIYDITGKLIKILCDSKFHQGRYSITFDATGLSTGIYFYHIEGDSFSDSRKMIVTK